MAASILQIGISRNPICDNLVDFPKLGHILIVIVKYCNSEVKLSKIKHMKYFQQYVTIIIC